jgi:hypothetical protein
MLKRTFYSLALCLIVLCPNGDAQDCAPPSIVANAKAQTLFSPEQEMIFGELVIQKMAGDLHLIRDDALVAYITEIGNRLTKHLPQTGLTFHYHLIDLPDANAFNTPGGHVFITRKLVAFTVNEDELAGVIAHELGHAVVRHVAVDISEALRKVLNVTALGDRKDVAEKYNMLIERARTRNVSKGRAHSDDQQLEADHIGLFAMVAAGYDPTAFFAFFDRLTESGGKTGNWFTELFGSSTPEEKRLREMASATEKLPAACRDGRAARTTERFLKWQADVVSFRPTARHEELPGLVWKKELTPKLRSDVSHFAFSPDGRFILAQDDFAITIIERDPLRVRFQIPIEHADEAAFTADGKFVVFTTENMRYEKWSVEEQKPTEMRELVVRRQCWEHKLSPDGNYMACVDKSANVNVVAIGTGKKVWEKKEFYRLTYTEYLAWLWASGDERKTSFFRIEFSPDSRVVMFSRSERFRYRLKVNEMAVAESEDTALALDLASFKPVAVGGDIKKLAARPYIFLDSEKVVGMPSLKSEEAGIFSFPGGKRLQKFALMSAEVKRTANPDYIIIKPLANAKMGIYDIKKGAVASGFDREDAALWNNLMVYESINGKVLLREVSYNEKEKKFDSKDAGTVELPVSSLKTLSAAEVSNNFDWLLLSSKSRGGLWDLGKGERKLYVRGFKSGLVTNDGGSLADFPKLDDVQHSLILLNPYTKSVAIFRELPENGAQQFGRFILLRYSLKDAPEGKKGNGQVSAPAGHESGPVDLSHGVGFDLKDIVQDKTIWSRDFAKGAPGYSFDSYSGRLILYWRLGSDVGAARLKESPELQAKANALGNKADDYLVEVIDALAQKTVGAILLETGNGSFDVGSAWSEADWLVLRDNRGRMLAYSIKDGELRQRFFGDKAALNPTRSQIAVESFPGEVTIYDLSTGDRQTSFVINGSAAFLRFNVEGNRLLILSDNQSVYAFDLNKPASATETK